MHVPFITPRFGLPVYFFMRITSRFLHLTAYDNQRGQNKTFWRILLKQIIKWGQVNNQVTSIKTFMYIIICYPTYTLHSSFTFNPNVIIQKSYHSKQWRVVSTKHFHFNSVVISELAWSPGSLTELSDAEHSRAREPGYLRI